MVDSSKNRNKKVLLGMSGGVDSSVAALLLKKEGYEVIGATMQLHEYCNNDDLVRDAQAVARKIGIEHFVFNMKEEFNKYVIDYFVQEYEEGRTPNPCIACNKYLKFGAMVEKAKEMKIPYIATGHYAIVEKKTGEFFLKKAKDATKDQSYVLYNLTQQLLSQTLFPLGEYSKKEIRKIAKSSNLEIENKSESQEICFIPDNNHFRFLKENAPKTINKGEIIDTDGNSLGYHEGTAKYTIGQRRGLGISSKTPLFVVDIVEESNQIVLGSNDDLFSNELLASNCNWISGDLPKGEIKAKAKIRYKAQESEATLYPLAEGKIKVVFSTPQRAITKGQSIVFYDKEYVLGGGIIAEVSLGNKQRNEDTSQS